MKIDKGNTKLNFLYNISYEVIRIIVPLLTTPYISRVLGSEGIGRYTLAQTYAQYFVLFGVIGLNSYAARELAYVRDNEDKFKSRFWEVFAAKLVTMGLAIAIYMLVFFGLGLGNLCNQICLIYLASEVFNISYYFTAVERFKTIAIRNTIIKFVSMLLIFAFVKKPEHVWLYTLILALSDVLGQVINWCSVDRLILKKPKLSFGDFKTMMRISVSLFLPTVAIQVYTMLDKVMLGIIVGESETGIYENANKLIRLASTVSGAVAAVYMPRMANNFANRKMESFFGSLRKVFQFSSFLCFPMCFGLIAIAKDFAPLYYGTQFKGIEVLFYLGAIMIVSLGWSGVLGDMVLVPAGKQKYYTIAVVCGALLNILMNSWMIPLWGASGAMIASVFAEVVGMSVMYTYIRRDFHVVGLLHGIWKYILSAVIMCIVVLVESAILSASAWIICIEIVSGAIIYIICLILLKDSIIKEVVLALQSTMYKLKNRKGNGERLCL